MKPINQNLRFFIHVILLALFCFAMAPSAIAGHIWQSVHDNTNERYSSRIMADTSNRPADHQKGDPMRPLMVADSTADETDEAADNSESGPDEEADMQATRQKMIDHCKANRGTDCEKAVDTELEAQQLGIVHTAPPLIKRIGQYNPDPSPDPDQRHPLEFRRRFLELQG